MVLAVNTGDAAMPLPSVVIVAVLSPPAKVPPAPEVGAENVTVTPLSGDPPELTHASMRTVNVPPTEALCPDPLNTAIDTTGAAAGLALLAPHAVSVEIMASAVSKRIDWRVFIARLSPFGFCSSSGFRDAIGVRARTYRDSSPLRKVLFSQFSEVNLI